MENGKNLNLLNSEMEKGKIWNGKSVPLDNKEIHSCHLIGYTFWLAAKDLLYAPFFVTSVVEH